jgi:hypothetical protein
MELTLRAKSQNIFQLEVEEVDRRGKVHRAQLLKS